MLDWELAQFDSAVDDVFGFRAVQVGLPEVDFLRQNRISYRFTLALEQGAAVAADPLQLPIASQSVDLVVLPHVLEGHHNPHDVLREVERVLMPEGHVVISGFNTASLWRVRQAFTFHRNGAPWDAKFIGLLRLREWLRVRLALVAGDRRHLRGARRKARARHAHHLPGLAPGARTPALGRGARVAKDPQKPPPWLSTSSRFTATARAAEIPGRAAGARCYDRTGRRRSSTAAKRKPRITAWS